MSIADEAQTSGSRWVTLALGTTAQAVASSLLFGLPFLLPYLRRTEGLTLVEGGALVAAPSLGMVVTLIAWGVFADWYGERLAIALGLGLTGVIGFASAGVSSLGARAALFTLLGAVAASVNSAKRPAGDGVVWGSTSAAWRWGSGRPGYRSAWHWPRPSYRQLPVRAGLGLRSLFRPRSAWS